MIRQQRITCSSSSIPPHQHLGSLVNPGKKRAKVKFTMEQGDSPRAVPAPSAEVSPAWRGRAGSPRLCLALELNELHGAAPCSQIPLFSSDSVPVQK